jgi:hypothetical protein
MAVLWWQYMYYAFSVALLIVNFLRDWVFAKPLPISVLLSKPLLMNAGVQTLTFDNLNAGTITFTDTAGSFGTQQWLVGNQNSTLVSCLSPGALNPKVCSLNPGTMVYTPSVNGYVWTAPQAIASVNFTATLVYSN